MLGPFDVMRWRRQHQDSMLSTYKPGFRMYPAIPSIIGLSPWPGFTLKGQCLMSAWMLASANFLPISRLASNTVLMGFMATCNGTISKATYHALAFEEAFDILVRVCVSCKLQVMSITPTVHGDTIRFARFRIGWRRYTATLQSNVEDHTWFLAASPIKRSVSVKPT